jgi:hypothetical protein
MNGYTTLIRAAAFEEAAHYSKCTELYAKAMELYHMSALDENERRKHGDKPDHIHLTYL